MTSERHDSHTPDDRTNRRGTDLPPDAPERSSDDTAAASASGAAGGVPGPRPPSDETAAAAGRVPSPGTSVDARGDVSSANEDDPDPADREARGRPRTAGAAGPSADGSDDAFRSRVAGSDTASADGSAASSTGTVPRPAAGRDTASADGSAASGSGAASGRAGAGPRAERSSGGIPDAYAANREDAVEPDAADGYPVTGAGLPQRPTSAPGVGSSAATADAEDTGSADGGDKEPDRLTARIEHAVGTFVDDPHAAVREADAVLDETARRLARLLDERRALLRDSWSGREAEDTERLRVALVRYRDMTRRLLDVA